LKETPTAPVALFQKVLNIWYFFKQWTFGKKTAFFLCQHHHQKERPSETENFTDLKGLNITGLPVGFGRAIWLAFEKPLPYYAHLGNLVMCFPRTLNTALS
jgi:hypothetical protein